MSDTQASTVKVSAARSGDSIEVAFAASLEQVTAMAQALSFENYGEVHAITQTGRGFSGREGGGFTMRFETADAATGVLNLLSTSLAPAFFSSARNTFKCQTFALEGVRQVAIDARAI